MRSKIKDNFYIRKSIFERFFAIDNLLVFQMLVHNWLKFVASGPLKHHKNAVSSERVEIDKHARIMVTSALIGKVEKKIALIQSHHLQ